MPATEEQVRKRLENGSYPEYRDVMKTYLKVLKIAAEQTISPLEDMSRIKDIKDARSIKLGEIVGIALPKPIATVMFDVRFPGTYRVDVQEDGSWIMVREYPTINPNDYGVIGGWDIGEKFE